MKANIGKLTVIAFGLAFAGMANALTFESINVTGDGIQIDWSYSKGEKWIDFNLPKAKVGDGLPARSGTAIITFNVKSDSPIVMTGVNWFLLGNFKGSGNVTYNELVEDLANTSNGQLAATSFVLNANSSMPASGSLKFKVASNYIRVKKTIELEALDTDAFDRASLPLVEQSFLCVPEPTSVMAFALGASALIIRRRRAR